MTKQLLSFHNDPNIKQMYIDRLKLHYKMDEIIKGQYWENGKGCAVGCTIHSDEHNEYETQLGLPEWLARLEDMLFETLPNKEAKNFPIELLQSIPIGVHLILVKHRFFNFCLTKICKNIDDPIVKPSIDKIIGYHNDVINGIIVSDDQWSAAWSAAESARSAAWSAVLARSADSEAAAVSARSAAESAAAAARSAESAAIICMKNELLRLLKEADQ